MGEVVWLHRSGRKAVRGQLPLGQLVQFPKQLKRRLRKPAPDPADTGAVPPDKLAQRSVVEALVSHPVGERHNPIVPLPHYSGQALCASGTLEQGEPRAHHAGMQRIGRPVGDKNARHFLREWREQRGLTQERLASRVGDKWDRTNLSKVERGKQGLTEDLIFALAEALNIEAGWLFVHPDVILARQELLAADPAEIRALMAALRTLKAS